MAGVFGKDPNMKKSNHAELAEAAVKFTQKRPVAPSSEAAVK